MNQFHLGVAVVFCDVLMTLALHVFSHSEHLQLIASSSEVSCSSKSYITP